MSASRFPGKPLADLGGRPIVRWVYDAATTCPAFDDVIVATDSREIVDCVAGFGGRVEETRSDHLTGSDRVAEVAERHPEADVLVNVQGDQPFATPEMLAALVQPYLDGRAPAMATLAAPIESDADRENPNVVKVVTDLSGRALYFSRSAIPHARGGGPVEAFHHLGLYAFTRATLLRFPTLEPTPLEQAEALEQLRALEHGIGIHVSVVPRSVLEINTPEDLEAARALVGA